MDYYAFIVSCVRSNTAEGRWDETASTEEQCQLTLRKELDIEPDDRTRRLYRSIIGGIIAGFTAESAEIAEGSERLLREKSFENIY